MNVDELQKKVAYLEFANDQLDAEMSQLNELLCAVGFPKGVESAKLVAQELLEDE